MLYRTVTRDFTMILRLVFSGGIKHTIEAVIACSRSNASICAQGMRRPFQAHPPDVLEWRLARAIPSSVFVAGRDSAAYNLMHIIVYVYVHAAYFLQCFLLCCVLMYTMLAHFSLLLLLLLN